MTIQIKSMDDLVNLIKNQVGEAVAEKYQEMTENRKSVASMLIGEPEKETKPQEKGLQAARFIRALAAAKGDPDRAAKLAKEKWRDEVLAAALSTSAVEEGGALVPDQYVDEVIDLLRAKTVVRRLGAGSMPMVGSASIPFLSEGSTANYVGENKNINPSQQKFGMLQLSEKKLAAIVPVSNDLLRNSSGRADAIVRNDMVRSLGLREDLAFIRGDGTENTPKGMRYWADTANVFAATQSGASATVAEVIADLGKAVRLLEEGNVPMENAGWAFTPRVKWFLRTLVNANGQYIFRDEIDNGTLLGFPFATTTQIPNNLGGGANESEIYLADFSTLVIAESAQIMIDVFQGGAYFDGSQVVSGISTDQTVVRAIAKHDFGARYRGKEIAVITGCKWGA